MAQSSQWDPTLHYLDLFRLQPGRTVRVHYVVRNGVNIRVTTIEDEIPLPVPSPPPQPNDFHAMAKGSGKGGK